MKVEEKIIQSINLAVVEEEDSLQKEIADLQGDLSSINALERTIIVSTGGSDADLVAEQTAEIEL